MAGNYPDPVGPRMAWDRDGTILYRFYPDNIVLLPTPPYTQLNDETPSTFGPGVGATESSITYGMVFPQLRQITHFFVAIDEFFGVGPYDRIEYSTDTTNGYDGTWLSAGVAGLPFAPLRSNSPVPYYRDPSYLHATPNATSCRAFRWHVAQGNASAHHPHTIHLYGRILETETDDRVRIWHPTLSQPLADTPAYLDWGDVPRTSSETRTFRVKNYSTDKTATSVVISVDTLSDTTPTIPPQFTLSTDNVTFTPTITLASLAPGAVSSTLYIKRTTPSNAALSIWTCRLIAAPGTMT